MADTSPVILVAGTASVPASYVVPPTQELSPLVCNATFDGTNAAGSFLPTLEIVSDGGVVIARCPVAVEDQVAAGDSAEVTFAPFLRQGRYSTGYNLIEQAGSALPRETTINFSGPGVTVSDDPTNGSTDVAISSGAGGALTLITSGTLAADGLFSLTGITQAYTDLILVVVGWSAAAGSTGSQANCTLVLNADTNAAYGGSSVVAGASVSGSHGWNVVPSQNCFLNPSNSTYPGRLEATIYSYSSALPAKHFEIRSAAVWDGSSGGGATSAWVADGYGSTNAITRLDLWGAGSASALKAGTVYQLYGRG